MNVKQLFEKAKTLTGSELNDFWVGLGEAITKNIPFNGIPVSDIKNHLVSPASETCPCGNMSFNCICGLDAE